MCGIAGIFSFRNDEAVSPALIKKMTDAVQHRGPDGEGVFVHRPIGLGHRRLAIIDLSDHARQPMAGPDGTTQIVFNGEIYNFRELRAGLEAKGHRFHTESDTEVILHAYQEYGTDCVTHFNGMFAFALWDDRRKTLLLARDRFGIKPLYIYRDSNRLLFASEIKALLTVMDTRPQPHQRLVYDFLTVGALDHTDDTFFESIQKVPAAHYLLIDSDGTEKRKQYWDFEVNNDIVQLADDVVGEKAAAFFELFTDAVRAHLISDVPVGSCLSGGLDSSAVVSVIKRLIEIDEAKAVGARQQTFSACYKNSRVDEQSFIDEVIRSTGALSHRVFPEASGFRDDLPQILRHQEEPFGSTSIYAQWEVMRKAREQSVTVLLDGQGADEQLLGYRKFYAFYGCSLWRRGRRWTAVKESVKHFGSTEVLKTLKLRHGLRYLHSDRFGPIALAHELLDESFAAAFRGQTLHLGNDGDLGARIKADMTRFSLPVLLRYEDKSSMAFSRESRVPFLDHRLVEYVASLPLNLKLRDGWTKYCLRRGGRGIIPEKILGRKDKLGFATPEEEWVRQYLKEDFHQTFAQASFLPEFVKLPLLQQHFEAYLRGKRPLLSSEFFFRFFILEKWGRSWLLNTRDC
jgi:asparagine synthase (glutamine-hydrolysing)